MGRKPTTLNVVRVRALAAHFRSLPETQNFNQSRLGVEYDDQMRMLSLSMGRSVGKCGTPACVGGHAVALFDPDFVPGCDPDCDGGVLSRAAELLGLNPDQITRLFYRGYYDPPFNENPPTAAMAAVVLDVLADTGKADWHAVAVR